MSLKYWNKKTRKANYAVSTRSSCVTAEQGGNVCTSATVFLILPRGTEVLPATRSMRGISGLSQEDSCRAKGVRFVKMSMNASSDQQTHLGTYLDVASDVSVICFVTTDNREKLAKEAGLVFS